jgi:hypothetical protein
VFCGRSLLFRLHYHQTWSQKHQTLNLDTTSYRYLLNKIKLINHNELKLKTKTFDTINCHKRIKHGHRTQKQQTLYSNAKSYI